MSEHISMMIPEEELSDRIKELGRQISEDYAGQELIMVCVLKGATFFACELAKRITVPVVIDFMIASSYGSGTESNGDVCIKKDLDIDITGKNVLIAEDIIDSGNTLKKLLKVFEQRGAASIKVCTMLDKPERRVVELTADYTGFTVPNQFIVGYGLDYDQKYRNLPYIGIVSFDEEEAD